MPASTEILNDSLKPRVLELLSKWLPGGRLVGREYRCAGKMGGNGDNLTYNVDEGVLVELYSRINNLSIDEACSRLEIMVKDSAQVAIQVNVNNGIDEPVVTTSLFSLWENLGIACTGQGNPIANLSNVVRILEGETFFKENIWFDEFHLLARAKLKGKTIDLDENYLLNLRLSIQRNYGITRINAADVRDAVALISKRNIKNEPKDYMNSIEWDNVPRIQTFFCDCVGAPDNEYTRSASRNFWISMVARVFNPGCIMRTMVVFKGRQWTGKSTVFAAIGGQWYAEVLENIHTNNFLQSLNGNIIMEFADLSGFVRADINRIKQIISCRKDRYRAPYDRAPATHLRQCVFTATTNEHDFLRDDTGNTRFWPIETGGISISKIIDNRDQLFAEAVHLYKGGADWYIMPDETTAEQEKYRSSDEWEEAIAEYVKPQQQTTIRELATECLKIDIGKLDKSLQMRIGRVLILLGWRKDIVWQDGKAARIWTPKHNDDSNQKIEWDE